MAKNANLYIRTDEETKAKAEAIFNQLGITVTNAVNMFLHKSILMGGIPFDVRITNIETLSAIEDVNSRQNIHGPFESVAELMEDLNA